MDNATGQHIFNQLVYYSISLAINWLQQYNDRIIIAIKIRSHYKNVITNFLVGPILSSTNFRFERNILNVKLMKSSKMNKWRKYLISLCKKEHTIFFVSYFGNNCFIQHVQCNLFLSHMNAMVVKGAYAIF